MRVTDQLEPDGKAVCVRAARNRNRRQAYKTRRQRETSRCRIDLFIALERRSYGFSRRRYNGVDLLKERTNIGYHVRTKPQLAVVSFFRNCSPASDIRAHHGAESVLAVFGPCIQIAENLVKFIKENVEKTFVVHAGEKRVLNRHAADTEMLEARDGLGNRGNDL